MAIRAEQWAEAARLFASAYDRAAEAEQGKVAFYWGLALYRQGEAIAKANLEGDEELAHRARQYFEEARTVLQDAEHPMRARVLQAIDQFLLIQIADRGT